jgi:hypothetical protein
MEYTSKKKPEELKKTGYAKALSTEPARPQPGLLRGLHDGLPTRDYLEAPDSSWPTTDAL